MVAANEVPEKVILEGTVDYLREQRRLKAVTVRQLVLPILMYSHLRFSPHPYIAGHSEMSAPRGGEAGAQDYCNKTFPDFSQHVLYQVSVTAMDLECGTAAFPHSFKDCRTNMKVVALCPHENLNRTLLSFVTQR